MKKLIAITEPQQLNACHCPECRAMQRQGYIFFTYSLFGYYESLSVALSNILKEQVVYYCNKWIRVKGLPT